MPASAFSFRGIVLVAALAISGSAASAQQEQRSTSPSPRHGNQVMPSGAQPTAATSAANQHGGPSAKPAAKLRAAHPYFVEFRARYALSYGHTYAVHGRVGQKITKKDVVGLHPATESSIPWMIGHIIPVISETGASDGDAEEQYVSARYRILLTAAEYAKMTAFLDRLKSRSVLWHAALYNCNKFVGDIANFAGLAAPSHFLYPKEFINEMRSLNNGRTRVAADAPLYKE